MTVLDRLHDALAAELAALAQSGALGALTPDAAAKAAFTLERPKRAEHGDYATNAAMVLTKLAGKPPRAIAEALVQALATSEVVASAEVAGPGFVNLRVKPAILHAELGEMLRLGGGYGHAPAATGERVDVEFVSANPTGPLLVSHGRGAVYGDAVARLLEATGNRVTREYYVNDFGNQVRLLAASVRAMARGEPVPEGGYGGDYVKDLVEQLRPLGALEQGDEKLARTSVMLMMRGIRRTLAALGVVFDVWFSESSLHEWGAVGAALEQLRAGGYLVEKDGATFFVATSLTEGDGGDKDRVVRKSDGVYTYFASDIAYHADKVARGYDRLVNVLGADHHGYVARVRNSLEALGLPADRFEALLFQLVFLYRNGELVKFGKRKGTIFTLDELMEEIDEAAGRRGAGADAIRFFYLSRSANTNVDFDIELAKKASLDNPVFYVQYGHARLCSILRNAVELGLTPSSDLSRLTGADELALARKLADYPETVAQAAAAREPHRVLFFVQDLARDFQSYYTLHKSDPVLPPRSVRESPELRATWDFALTEARLGWITALRTVYASALGLLGISAPERMSRPEVGDLGPSEAEES